MPKNEDLIKSKALEFGFISCGISKATFLEEEANKLDLWLKQGMHGKMGYMENHYDLRLDPRLFFSGAKSVISLLFNYHNPEVEKKTSDVKISSYAQGVDYHKVVKKKLKSLLNELTKEIGHFEGRAFVDSAPIMEKAWAAKSGLGWIGKNSNLISRTSGSFFFLAEIITDLELTPDAPINDYCGTCTKCIDACPTNAIPNPYVVDGSKCISYLTIELKSAIPDEFKGKMDNWLFGCDICQTVCPWNRFAKNHQEDAFTPNEAISNYSINDWLEITDDVFETVFKSSPLKRAGAEKLRQTARFILKP